MQITALLSRSGFNDLESIQAKWLLILLQTEDAPQKLEPPGHMFHIRADGLIFLLQFLVGFRVNLLHLFFVFECVFFPS